MRRLMPGLCLVLGALMALPVAAPAATTSGKTPKIKLVSPMRVKVGRKLTIRGSNFSRRRKRNTVIFRGPNRRTAFVKPRRASRTKLVVVVPRKLEGLLRKKKGSRTATRFRIRVLVGKRFGKFTPRRLSPVVVSRLGSIDVPGGGGPGGGPGGGASCDPGTDEDRDLLDTGLEDDIGTDPCNEDSDGDGVHDGYEYQSAVDLNHYPGTSPLPYPGKRPYPNALDPTDFVIDYDGDGLGLRDEFLAWFRYSADGVRRSGRPTALSNLLYSDGLQKSIDPPPSAPATPLLLNWALDRDEDGELWDDDRDVDGDGLNNIDETHLQLVESWWVSQHDGENEPKESKYPGIDFLDIEDIPARDPHVDPDVDGDGLLDGADDVDHDGLTNQFEVRRPGDWLTDAFTAVGDPPTFFPGPNQWAYVHPFNPCKPFRSERCHKYVPFGYYEGDEVPPVGPDTPGPQPATPDG